MFVEDLDVPDIVKRIVIESGITELYPPQIEAVKTGFLKGENLVLCIPTASGKTLVAEFAMAKSIIERGGKALYLVPLKALASEKYDEFQKWEKAGFKVGITSSDFDSSDAWLEGYDIIVGTNEKLDSLLRHNVRWLCDIRLIVADEVHLINDGSRGPTLEVILSKLKRVNKNAQFLALSATIANANEVADIITRKTGLETRVAVLGHIQRGGSPTAKDRIMASKLGNYAIDILTNGETDKCVCLNNGNPSSFDLSQAIKKKIIDTDKIDNLIKLLT